MANQTTRSNQGKVTSLISASVLVTGLLLMAFVSGARESTAAAPTVQTAHAAP